MSDLIGQVNNRIYIKRWRGFALLTVKFTGIKVTHNSSAPFDLNNTSLRIYSVTPFHYISVLLGSGLFPSFRISWTQGCIALRRFDLTIIQSLSFEFYHSLTISAGLKKNTKWQALDYFNWQRNHGLTCSVSRPFSSVGFPSVIRIIRGQSFLPFTLTTPPKNLKETIRAGKIKRCLSN